MFNTDREEKKKKSKSTVAIFQWSSHSTAILHFE